MSPGPGKTIAPLFGGQEAVYLLSLLFSMRDVFAADAAVGTETLRSFPFDLDYEVMLSILKRTLTAAALYFSYSNTTSTHFNSFSQIFSRLESCPR